MLRAVCKPGQMPDGATPVDNPSLEESYLSFMVARDRADAARVAESAEEVA